MVFEIDIRTNKDRNRFIKNINKFMLNQMEIIKNGNLDTHSYRLSAMCVHKTSLSEPIEYNVVEIKHIFPTVILIVSYVSDQFGGVVQGTHTEQVESHKVTDLSNLVLSSFDRLIKYAVSKGYEINHIGMHKIREGDGVQVSNQMKETLKLLYNRGD